MKLKEIFKRLVPVFIGTVSVAAVSEVIRFFAVTFLKPAGNAPVLNGIFQLNYHINTGASFGMFSEHTAALSVFTALLIAFLYILSAIGFFETKAQRIIVGLIAGGGMANLIERILYGYVVDYFEFLFIDFAIFNFADWFVTVGSVALMVWIFLIDKTVFKDEKK
jgi:signal peptidase II